jgi:drug/metabolite transporter (DMT)-like permease
MRRNSRSILFALLLLGEVPSVREVVGGAVILGAVIYAQLREN